ncbi:MAG TPA: GNAT family N-acetyltransferase [Vicinamibacterales bacterium]|nr:GNAT family N-acetyltransferase [Vicinamibacterales bacterium]
MKDRSSGRSSVQIRPFAAADWDGVWAILEPVFRAGETYAFARDISAADARAAWTSAPKQVFVAADESTGELLGTYYLRPNFEGAASHICNCGYVVSEHARGRGVAAQMCEHSQAEAAARGYRSMQFNLVIATNEGAVHLWKKMGFAIIGTVPEAFRHPRLGFVDAHIMYKRLPPSR